MGSVWLSSISIQSHECGADRIPTSCAMVRLTHAKGPERLGGADVDIMVRVKPDGFLFN